MGYRHSREEILAAACAVARQDGMAGLTYARVGERLGISDRTVVYYFPSKPDLVTAVVETLGAHLVTLLEQAFGNEPQTGADLIQRAWPVLTTPDADRVFALYFEMVGLAAAKEPPYDALTSALVGAWAEWLAPRLIGSTPDVRRRRALATIAQIDGLLLLRQTIGPGAAEDAARELGGRALRP